MEQGTKINEDWKDMEQEVTLHLAASQSRLDQMIQQIQAWTTPRHQPTEWLAAQKKKIEAEAFYQLEKERLQFFVSLWETLKQMKEKSPFIQLLPTLYTKDWECDGILLTTGGVYVFHLLPCRLTEFSLEHPILSVTGAKPVPVFQQENTYSIAYEKGLAKLWILGQDREKIHHLQKKLAIPSLPVYELYVAPFGARNIRFLFEETAIASSEQIFGMLQNLTIQPNREQFENQQKLFYDLSIYARPYEISLLSAQKTVRRVSPQAYTIETEQSIVQAEPPVEVKMTESPLIPSADEAIPATASSPFESVELPVEEQRVPLPPEPEESLRLGEGAVLSQKINDLFVENEQITLVPKSRKRAKESFTDHLLNKLFGKKSSQKHSHRKK
jgi:hypothetical protein